MDLDGNRICESVDDLFVNYFKRDKYIFVNKNNNTNIPLSTEIIAKSNINKEIITSKGAYSKWCTTPKYMSSMPLNASQVENLAAYCAKKNVTIFDFLFNEMGFKPTGMSAAEKMDPKKIALQPFEMELGMEFDNGIPRSVTTYYPRGLNVTGSVVIPTGAQKICKNRPGGGKAWLTYNAVNAAKVGAKSETITFDKCCVEAHGGLSDHKLINNTMIFFQGR